MTDIPNGIPALPPLNLRNPVVQILEQVLSEARAGRVSSIALVVVAGGGGFAPFCVGSQLGDLYLGLASIQQDVLNAVKSPQNRSQIIRPPLGAQ